MRREREKIASVIIHLERLAENPVGTPKETSLETASLIEDMLYPKINRLKKIFKKKFPR